MSVVQPIDYTSGNGFAQGLQLKGLQDEIQQRAMAAEQAQIDRDNNAKFQQEWQQSFGDPEKMTSLAAKYPGQMDLIKSGIGFQNEQHQLALGNAARDLRVAIATNNPQAVQQVAVKHASVLNSVGSSPEEIMQQLQEDPGGLSRIVDTVGMSALGVKEYYDVAGAKETREETARSNRAGEALTARRDEQSNARGWAGISIQRQNADTARGRLEMDRKKQSSKSAGGDGERTVQLSDGRTVTVSGKLHGAGANAFYEGVDNSGNTVRVPANAIAAPASSTSNATNYAMKKDIDAILNADPEMLALMTGVTGGAGSPAVGADYRSRWRGKDERQLYLAGQRIQGRMQNQGIAAAKEMGASGINTIPEAKMYFQGMPQIDYSSPESMQQSIREIKEYTDNYNQQYNADVGGSKPSSKQQPAKQQSGYSSLWGD